MLFHPELRQKMEAKSQFHFCPNFSDLTIYQAKVANYSTTISSAICLSLLLLLLGLLVLYKAYKTTLQRLFLEYTTAVAITNVVRVLNIELQFDVNKNFCNWLALLEQWWVMTVQILALSLVLYLFSETCQKLRSRPPFPCFKNVSKRSAIVIEVLYTSLAVLLPLAYVWVPMKHHKYGLAQSLCWLVTYDTNCNEIEGGKVYVNVYENLIFTLQSIITLLLLGLIMLFYVMILRYQWNRESRFNNNVCRASVVLLVLCITVLAKLSETITNLGYLGILNLPINAFYYDVIDDLIQTIAGTTLPLGFAVYLYSPNKLRPGSLKKAAREWHEGKWTCAHCCSPRASNKDFNTYESSNQYFTPNITTYSTPYVNEFINIAEMTEYQTVPQYGTIQHS